MLGAVGRCCTGALQALKPGVQPLKALVGSPAVLSRKSCMLGGFDRNRGRKRCIQAPVRRAGAMLTLATASSTLSVLPAPEQALRLKCQN